MILASAYPSPDISAGAMMAIAFVMVGVLAFWLGMVYLADRGTSKPDTKGTRGFTTTTVATPGSTAEDEHSTAGQHAAEHHGAAA